MSFLKRQEKTIRMVYVVLACLVALGFELLVIGHAVGLGFVLLIVGSLLVFTGLSVWSNHHRRTAAYWLLIPIAFLLTSVMLYSNTLVRFVVPTVIVALSFLYTIFLTLHNPEKHPLFLSKIPLLSDIDLVFQKWGMVWKDLFRWKRPGSPLFKKILTGVLIATPLLVIFSVLFAQADVIFAEWFKKIFYIDIELRTLYRMVRVIVVALWLAGLFYVLIDDEQTVGKKEERVYGIDQVVIGTVLALVNVLFLVFVLIQVRYLFGDYQFVLDQKIVFADYARKGFFQLVWVMVIAGAMLMTTYRMYTHTKLASWMIGLKLLLVAQVGVVAISALKRMNIYQEAYGFTVQRLYVEWFIYIVCTALVCLAIALLLRVSFKKFLHVSLLGAIGVFTLISLINVDYLIVKKNVDRYLTQEKTLDIDYVMQLSADGIPGLKNMLVEDQFAHTTQYEKLLLSTIIIDIKNTIGDRQGQGWRAFHLGAKKVEYFLFTLPESVQEHVKTFTTREAAYKKYSGYAKKERQERDCYKYEGQLEEPSEIGRLLDCVLVKVKEKNYLVGISKSNYNDSSFVRQEQQVLVYQELPNKKFYNVKTFTLELFNQSVGSRMLRVPTSVNGYPTGVNVELGFLSDNAILQQDPNTLTQVKYTLDQSPTGELVLIKTNL